MPDSNPGRTLAVDVGNRRTGIALSDPLGITARPVAVLEHDGPPPVAEVARIAADRDAARIVVGLPVLPSGDWTSHTRAVAAFASRLEAAAGVPVTLWDESYTTQVAGERRQRRGEGAAEGPIDAEAAAVILEEWLRSQEPRGGAGSRTPAEPSR